MKGIIGKKLGMTQVYDSTGAIQPVTVIEAGALHRPRLAHRQEGRLQRRPAWLW